MRLRTHIIASALLGATIYRREPARAALLTLGGVLLDADHYLLYALRSGNWNPLGALRYDQWRHAPREDHDTRPRYGPLRSILHQPWLTLPLIWGLSRRWPALRPVAIGVSLHLALDIPYMQMDWRIWRRAAGRCERCGAHGRKLQIVYLLPPRYGGARWDAANRAAWCRPCVREVYDW
jgi:hypothetical protein